MTVIYNVEDIAYSDRVKCRHRTKSAQERIAELEEEVAYYKSELGVQIDNTHIYRICKAIKITPGTAHFIMALYNAKGRVLTREQICDLLPGQSDDDLRDDTRGPNIINTYAVITRKALGEESIDTAWGTGYCITSYGKSKVSEIIFLSGE